MRMPSRPSCSSPGAATVTSWRRASTFAISQPRISGALMRSAIGP